MISLALEQGCREASGFPGFREQSAPCQRESRSSEMTTISFVIDVCCKGDISTVPLSGSNRALSTPTLFAVSRSERSRKKFSSGVRDRKLTDWSSLAYVVLRCDTDARNVG